MVFETTYLGNGIIVLLSIFFVIILLLFFSFKLEKEHIFLKLFCLIFAFWILLLVPKVAIDYSGDCIITATNSTTLGNTTSYVYESRCYASPHTTTTTLYEALLFFLKALIIYFGIFYFWYFMKQADIFTKRFK